MTLTGTATTTIDLFQASYPCTIAGIRWSCVGVNAQTFTKWCIHILREGEPNKNVNFGGALMNPESDVIAFGTFGTAAAPGPALIPFEGSTKTMRKLQSGDKLCISAANSIVAAGTIQYIVQWFALA